MKRRRKWVVRAVVAAVAVAAVVAAMMPRPIPVDVGQAARGPMRVTADGLGQTRVRDRFVVATPVSGHLARIALRAGDRVQPGQVIAVVRPPTPMPLDARTRSEATARLAAAKAVAAEARSAVEAARVAAAQARREQARVEVLFQGATVAERDVEAARTEADVRTKAVQQAEAAAAAARRQVEAVAAVLDDTHGNAAGTEVPVASPAGGTILRVVQESEGPVAAGMPLVEIGDPASLEVIVDLPTPLAVQVNPRAAVEITRWGGATPLAGRVRHVEPAGFTKISALGVEEQRVLVVIDPVRDPESGEGWDRLGDGFRVETAITLWQSDDVLTVPEGAVFRHGDGWATFAVRDGRAARVAVEAGHRDGRRVEIRSGLAAGDPVVLFPGDRVEDGVRVQAAP